MSRQQQGGQSGVGDDLRHRLDPSPVGAGAEAVVEAGAREAIAMADLDGIDNIIGSKQRDGWR